MNLDNKIILSVTKRDGQVVSFNVNRIEFAVNAALKESGMD